MKSGEVEEERAYGYWLHNLPGVGDRTIEKLLKVFGSAKQVYHAGQDAQRQVLKEKQALEAVEFSKGWNVEKKYEELKKRGIMFLPFDDVRYPKRLGKLTHPPYALYCLGSLPKEQTVSVAVIGARECSEYGSFMAGAFAGRLARAGVSVISGMARGIDGIGQKAALDCGGMTYAVLGSGVDVCYPSSNRVLYEEILEKGGGILSPFPPGTKPLKQHFPERNRIVSGLSDVILVVEARLKSGTWITVDMALEQGKNVYAVPGRLTDRLSDGCNFLIRQGAGIALTPEDILTELAVLQNRKEIKNMEETKNREKYVEPETGVLSFLDAYPKSADEILEAMRKEGRKIELPHLFEELISLCLEKKVRQVSGNYFAKVSSCDIIGEKENQAMSKMAYR